MGLRLLTALVLAAAALVATPAAGQSPPAPQRPRDTPDASIRDGSAQRALDRARRRWHRADIHNYRLDVSRLCFCLPGDGVVFVRDDRPVRPPSTLREVATVPRLQRRVQEAIDAKAAGLDVAYDRRGVPRRIAIDDHVFVADDEITYSVDHFWRGTKGRGGPDAPAR